MSQSILITGAAGKLGAAVWALLPESIGTTRADFDLSNVSQMSAFLDTTSSSNYHLTLRSNDFSSKN